MLEVLREAARIIEMGQKAALATIISTTGSTPGKEGAKMLVRADGSTVGTVGGGCTEADIWRISMEVMAAGTAMRKSFRLTAATVAETGLLCGGEFEVYIEPIGAPSVIILGGGHIATALVKVLSTLDWRITVIDDRSDFAHPERFPLADEVLCRPFEECLEGVCVTANSCIVVVTRGHQHDELALSRALETSAGYIGLIGSRGKIGAIVKNLRESGVSTANLERVRAPMGIPIGSRTPEEIAISICAELIGLHRGEVDRHHNQGNSSKRALTSPTD
ncbi:MAG TPA: xanthine dehydrogenase [Planctomycetes bacterium]|nr:xanthine dehydrogenase [Planctomycetota bacterium]